MEKGTYSDPRCCGCRPGDMECGDFYCDQHEGEMVERKKLLAELFLNPPPNWPLFMDEFAPVSREHAAEIKEKLTAHQQELDNLKLPEGYHHIKVAPKPYHSGSLYNRTMDRIADAINSHIPPAQIEELDVLSRSRAE